MPHSCLNLKGIWHHYGRDSTSGWTLKDIDFQLNPGELIVYPSNTIHSVEEVTYGERLVCVGWIHSYIPSNEDRNSLFSLDSGAKSLLAEHGQSPELDLIFQAYTNLLRKLGN